MSSIDEFRLDEKQQQQQQQRNIYSLSYTDVLSLSIGNMSEIDLYHITNRNLTNNANYLAHDFQSISVLYGIILGFVCAFLCLLTITGNFLVLITFRRIKTVGNLFILSLATADLIVGCFVMPLAGIYAIMEKWKMGRVLCKIWISVDFIASTASIFNLLTLSLDRYWSITSPLQYLGKRTRTRALLLIGFAWGLSLLWVIPIFSWHHFDNSQSYFEPDKCEPEYTHSKVFKVSTAMLNFYLPLLVLILLNGRIYYEIKRRYKNVLLHRHSTQIGDSMTNANSSFNHKPNYARKPSCSPITVTLCDSDRQGYSSTLNYTENDGSITSKTSAKAPLYNNNNPNNNESILRINFKERKPRPSIPMRFADQLDPTIKRRYSLADKNHCTQDELTWFIQRRKHSHSSFSRLPATVIANYKYDHSRSNHLEIKESSFKNNTDVHLHRRNSSKLTRDSAKSSSLYNDGHCHGPLHRLNSLLDSEKLSDSSSSMNTFNLCHCCSSPKRMITIHANPLASNHHSPSHENYTQQTQGSPSSSVYRSSLKRKSQQPSRQSMSSSHRLQSATASPNSHRSSISQFYHYRATAGSIKQSTIWNQQEKAFRQLFAIVFGFTCCFLPYFILYMVVAFCGSCVSERVVTATIWLGYVNSTMNPFLYALSNKHFRRTFNRLLKRDSRPQSYYN